MAMMHCFSLFPFLFPSLDHNVSYVIDGVYSGINKPNQTVIGALRLGLRPLRIARAAAVVFTAVAGPLLQWRAWEEGGEREKVPLFFPLYFSLLLWKHRPDAS